MKKDQVKLGGIYLAKVSGKIAHVRLDAVSRHGGWEAFNLDTRKTVRIKSAQRLRGQVGNLTPAAKARTTTINAGGGILVDVVETASETPTTAAPETTTPAEIQQMAEEFQSHPSERQPRTPKADVQDGYAPQSTISDEAKAVTKSFRTAKAPKEPKVKKTSGLDLAAQVLKDKGRPMNAKDIADAVIAAGWKTNGKTPHATLYSAMIHEIDAKPGESRFVKTSRGLFAFATAKA